MSLVYVVIPCEVDRGVDGLGAPQGELVGDVELFRSEAEAVDRAYVILAETYCSFVGIWRRLDDYEAVWIGMVGHVKCGESAWFPGSRDYAQQIDVAVTKLLDAARSIPTTSPME